MWARARLATSLGLHFGVCQVKGGRAELRKAFRPSPRNPRKGNAGQGLCTGTFQIPWSFLALLSGEQVTLALSSARPALGEFFFWPYELKPRAPPELNSRGLHTWPGRGASADGRPPVEGWL